MRTGKEISSCTNKGHNIIFMCITKPCAFISWKCNFYFLNIFIEDCNFLTKFCCPDPSFSSNNLKLLYLKPELLRMRNYAITRSYILYTSFTTWCQLETYTEDTLTNGINRQYHECDHVDFLRNTFRRAVSY